MPFEVPPLQGVRIELERSGKLLPGAVVIFHFEVGRAQVGVKCCLIFVELDGPFVISYRF